MDSSHVEKPSAETKTSPKSEWPADGPPSVADGPPSVADGPPSVADGPPSVASSSSAKTSSCQASPELPEVPFFLKLKKTTNRTMMMSGAVDSS